MHKLALSLIVSAAALLMTPLPARCNSERAASERILDQIVQSEQGFLKQIRSRTPLLETYIQEDGSAERTSLDHYFLGRLSFGQGLEYLPIVTSSAPPKGSKIWGMKSARMQFLPSGFAQMLFPDMNNFDRNHYSFEYVRREFLGDVRCLVFDAVPLAKNGNGQFIGRIWVEDKDFHIVRFNGTYTRSKSSHLYFHFDSWRTNISPGQWVPTAIYVEEAGEKRKGAVEVGFKAQTRIWGYNSGKAAVLDELTSIAIEMDQPARDVVSATDVSPLESQRSWERQAERNIIERLEKSGLVAPVGEVDKVLNTVVSNLAVTNSLTVETQCRVLLTTPLETFSVGRTIFISRGLLDVLPDEASLAIVLSEELAHVVLGHRTRTQFAFQDQTMFSDLDLLERFRFSRSPEEIKAAAQRAVELLRLSPYKDKMANAGLFLKALSSRASLFPNLIRPNLGNQLTQADSSVRMEALASQAPVLEEDKLDQIAALPLGSRISLEPWTNVIKLIKTRPISLLTAREKMIFEITPFMPYLTRAAESALSGGGQQ